MRLTLRLCESSSPVPHGRHLMDGVKLPGDSCAKLKEMQLIYNWTDVSSTTV